MTLWNARAKRIAITIGSTLALCHCAGHPSPGGGASQAQDIVAPSLGVALGRNWYPLESYGNQTFRWVRNDAEFVVLAPSGPLKKLAFVVEAGPGVARPDFTLHVRRGGNDVAATQVVGRERVAFDLPVQPGEDEAFELHVESAGRRSAHDSRILNFRVFSIEDRSSDVSLAPGHPDIVKSSNVTLEKNWGPLEEYGGDIFRWVDNDAEISVMSATSQQRQLALTVQGGPSVTPAAGFSLQIFDRSGRLVAAPRVAARATLRVGLRLRPGSNLYRLHVDSTGRGSPSDPRVLDFRVFSLAAL